MATTGAPRAREKGDYASARSQLQASPASPGLAFIYLYGWAVGEHPHKETFNHLSSLHIFPALLPSIDFQYFYDKRPVGGQSESIKE